MLFASQECTAVYVKEFPSFSYECKANCDCEKAVFVEQMNDFCMSLGDCGMSVNYRGDFGLPGYIVKRDRRPTFLSPGGAYFAQIALYHIPIFNKKVPVDSGAGFLYVFGRCGEWFIE
jgi:hypothetical protein